MDKIPAVLVTPAKCYGSGRDRYRHISGLTKDILAQVPEGHTILVPSHTKYQGQFYKKAIKDRKCWTHRQAEDSDYVIVKTI